MHALETQTWLRDALTSRGVGLSRAGDWDVGDGADAREAWAAFKELAAIRPDEPVVDEFGVRLHLPRAEEDGDLLGFETGLEPSLPASGDWNDADQAERRLVLSFNRLFNLEDDDGEYVGEYGLTLAFELHAPPGAGPAARAVIDGRGGGELGEEWARAVESSPAFRAAFEQHEPLRFRFLLSEV